MTFLGLAPAWAWLLIGASAAASAALFLIRPRPPHRTVGSLLIWNRVLERRRERDWWRRLRRAVSLALTVAIAVAIAAALARPVAAGRSAARRLIVIDSSWSMAARTPAGSTRWQRALDEARALARSSAGPVALATTGDGIVQGLTDDPALIDSALARLAPGAAAGAWPQTAGIDELHVITDGAARALPPNAIAHSVFAAAPNVAVTAFNVRAEPDGSQAEVYVEVANYADTAQPVRLTVTRGASTAFDRTIPLRAGEVRRQILPLPIEGDARLRAHVSAPADALDLDDDAAAWLWQAARLDVGVVGNGDDRLLRLLTQDPTVRVHRIAPAEYATSHVDAWILDRWLPSEPPDRPALVIDPPDAAWLGSRGAQEPDPVWPVHTNDPLLAGVDPLFIRIDRARAYRAQGLDVVAASVRGTPLVSRIERGGTPLILIDFAIDDANLADTPAFPVLVGNAIDHLARRWAGARRPLGVVTLPASTTRVVAPTGVDLPIARTADRVTARLNRPGLYLLDSGGGEDVITVALDDSALEDLRVSHLSPRQADSRSAAPHTWWVLIAATALGLIAVEWITWQRRITV
jgi:hypothetical protein